MAQAVSDRPRTAQSQVISCEICGGQSGTGTICFQYVCFSLLISFHRCCTLIFIYILLLPEGQTGESLETLRKALFFRK